MTKTADVNEVAAHFSEWLREVAAGHEVVLTENGRPVARVVSLPEQRLWTTATPQPAPALQEAKPGATASSLADWVHAHAHPGRPRSHHPVAQSELADELFDRE